MKRTATSLALLFFLTKGLFGQDLVREFELFPPKYKIHNSLYNKIDFLDSRGDSSRIGIVLAGLLKNHDAKFILKTPFLPQVQRLMNALTDSSAAEGELLFQLKQFNFIEASGTRYCYLGAALYVKKEQGYLGLSVLDTVIVVTAANVGKILTNAGNKIIANFIARGLLLQANEGVLYNMSSLENIDSVEKSHIPVYLATSYTDGIYLTYESFKNQRPEMKGQVDIKRDGSISSVKITDSLGKKIKLRSKSLYAVIAGGHPYIATEYGYYPLQKINDNFFFTGDIKIAASNQDIVSGELGFGLLGAGLAAMGSKARYDMIIDHLNGRFFHLREIKTETDTN